MTRQELARVLTIEEGGAQQVNIAQMNEVLKVLSKKLKGPGCAMVLKALLERLALVVWSGCAALPSVFTGKFDQVVKDGGAGQYVVACTASKDGKQLGKVSGELTCTADMMQLTGCHPKSIQFEGPK